MSEMKDEIYEGVVAIAEDINDTQANAVAEPDVNYFPANNYDDVFPIFLDEVAEQYPSEEFDEQELEEIFSEIWTGYRE